MMQVCAKFSNLHACLAPCTRLNRHVRVMCLQPNIYYYHVTWWLHNEPMTSCIAQVHTIVYVHDIGSHCTEESLLFSVVTVVRDPSSVCSVQWANHGSPCSVRGEQRSWCVCEAHECLLPSGHRRLPELLQVNVNPTVKSCTSLESSIDVYSHDSNMWGWALIEFFLCFQCVSRRVVRSDSSCPRIYWWLQNCWEIMCW